MTIRAKIARHASILCIVALNTQLTNTHITFLERVIGQDSNLLAKP